MDNSRGPMGPCAMEGCAAPGYARLTYPSQSRSPDGATFCRLHLEQMLKETGLWDKPAARALRAALEDDAS